MDRTSVDSSDVSVALANLASTSGAGWANRDREALYRRPDADPAPYRRPPAVNSFRDDADEEDMADSPSWSAFGSPRTGSSSAPDGPAAADPPEPAYGPAPPAGPGRASFGFTAGPISGNHVAGRSEPTSGAPFLPPSSGPAPQVTRPANREATTPGTAPYQPATGSMTGEQAAYRQAAGSVTGEQAAYPRAVGDQATYPRTARSTTGEHPAYAPATPSPFSPADSSSTAFSPATPSPFSPAAPSPAGRGRAPFPHEGRPLSDEQAAYPAAGRYGTGEQAAYPAAGRSATGEFAARPARFAPPVDQDEGIGDFIGGPGREIRPHRAARHPHAEQELPAEPPRRSRGVLIAGVALSAAVLLGATVAGVSYFSDSDKGLTSVLELGAGQSDDDRTATGPVDGRTAASFELATAVTKVTMRSEDLGDDLYRITTAEDAGLVPKPVMAQDRVQLNLVPDGDGSSGEVDVVLSSKVLWNLRFAGATDEQQIDFRGGAIGGIDLVGGSRITEIALPAPAGTVALKVTGAIDDLTLTSPKGNPVRVQMQGGAKTVAAGARTLRDIKPGSTLTPKNWATNDRYDVTAEARVTLLSVETA